MAGMQELVEQARALGQAIANHEQVKAYLAARGRVAEDREAQELLEAYRKQAERVRQLEAQQKPIEVADKRKLAEYEQNMASNAALKELLRAQVDYLGLMDQINRAMEAPLSQGPPSETAS
jgi:cell fate (sporulation/competence/biofilm development) regulator YlbF (YheA/YmcA/DUF963 family)